MSLLRDLVSARTWLAMTQHLAGLFGGFVAIFIVTFGLGFGVGGLFLALAGLPLLGLTLRLADVFARAERARFALFTGVRIPAWPAPGSPGRVGFRWGIIPRWPMWREGSTWAELGYALLRLPVSAVAATVSITAWAMGLVLLALPAYGRFMPSGGPTIGDTVLHTRAELTLSVVIGALLLLAAPQLTRGLAIADTALARRLLGPRRDLAARVIELERSRERVVDAGETERRRIERDLHDGAQQRLVALAMELGRAQAKFADDPDAARDRISREPGRRHGCHCSAGGGTPPLRAGRSVSYSVTWTERAISAGSGFLADDPEGLAQVLDATDDLAADPRPPGAFPYGGADLLRIRVGRYRILHEIDATGQSITVLHLGRVA